MKYKLKYGKRKTIGIRISSLEGVVVTAPINCPISEIEKVLKEKESWIIRSLKEVEVDLSSEKSMGEGGSLLYLGSYYPLKLRYSSLKPSSVTLKEGEAELRLNALLQFHEEQRRIVIVKELKAWYRERAYEYLKERLDYYSKLVGVKYNSLTIKDVKSRWGSCSSKGNINLDIKLMLLPTELIDYIVLHEVCHLKEMNHSKSYWTLVEAYMDDYLVREKNIKNLSPLVKVYWNKVHL
ncbi:M48 family metallopeptidase [Alloiococcus sp. CFN-8]|uniref:M48 family metallopeptidase n=1 Tax=Alloiococcus sp. CFN-8 TaxID=3416081 RepID=UPI003CEFEA8E